MGHTMLNGLKSSFCYLRRCALVSRRQHKKLITENCFNRDHALALNRHFKRRRLRPYSDVEVSPSIVVCNREARKRNRYYRWQGETQ